MGIQGSKEVVREGKKRWKGGKEEEGKKGNTKDCGGCSRTSFSVYRPIPDGETKNPVRTDYCGTLDGLHVTRARNTLPNKHTHTHVWRRSELSGALSVESCHTVVCRPADGKYTPTAEILIEICSAAVLSQYSVIEIDFRRRQGPDGENDD